MIKLFLSYPFHIIIFIKLIVKQNYAVLIGSPVHSNLGDHLLAVNSVKLLKDLGYRDLIEIPEFFYEIYKCIIKFKPNTDIFIVGGGWMGDLYEDELVIEDILNRYKSNRILILPQTIYFNGKNVFSSKQKLYKLLQGNNVKICVRDSDSFHILKSEFNFSSNKVFFSPDLGFYENASLISTKPEISNNNIILSLRDDVEKQLDYKGEIINFLTKNSYSWVESSTVLNKKYIPIKNRKKELIKKFKEFGSARLVITDRLHSMIFAVLCNTPCVVFDNSTHKVKNTVINWLSDNNNVYLMRELDCFYKKFPLIYEKTNNESTEPTLHKEFENLKRWIKTYERKDQ